MAVLVLRLAPLVHLVDGVMTVVCKNGHEYQPYKRSDGKRVCNECRLEAAERYRNKSKLTRPSQGIQPPRVPWLFQCPICDGFGHVQAEGRAWRRCSCNGRIWNQGGES